MEAETSIPSSSPTSAMSLAVAGGVSSVEEKEPRRWFVAMVMHNTEKACAQKVKPLLTDLTPEAERVETYVPTQREKHLWRNGRKKMVDRVVCPSYLFIRCTESTRYLLSKYAPFVKGFIKDHARIEDNSRITPFAYITDQQMDDFRSMVEQSEMPVTIDPSSIKRGDKVKVGAGPLKGLQGYVLHDGEGKAIFAICINILGSARVEIPISYLEYT